MDIKIKLKKLENFCNYLLEAINNLTKAHNTCMEEIENIVNKIDKSINDTNNKIDNLEDRVKHLEEYLDLHDSTNINLYNHLLDLKDETEKIKRDFENDYNAINYYNFKVHNDDIIRISNTVETIDTELSMLKDNIKELLEDKPK